MGAPFQCHCLAAVVCRGGNIELSFPRWRPCPPRTQRPTGGGQFSRHGVSPTRGYVQVRHMLAWRVPWTPPWGRWSMAGPGFPPLPPLTMSHIVSFCPTDAPADDGQADKSGASPHTHQLLTVCGQSPQAQERSSRRPHQCSSALPPPPSLARTLLNTIDMQT